MEESAADNWFDFEKRVRALEKTLGFKQYTERRARPILSATNAARLIYLGAIVMWIIAWVTGRSFL
jgi:hypothetical protein